MLDTTVRFSFNAGPAGLPSSCGVKPGPLATIGTDSPVALATPATEAVCVGPAETRIAFTPAARSVATWAERSVSVGLIFWPTTVRPDWPARYWLPLSAFSPKSPSK
jgi:hypothetical protein